MNSTPDLFSTASCGAQPVRWNNVGVDPKSTSSPTSFGFWDDSTFRSEDRRTTASACCWFCGKFRSLPVVTKTSPVDGQIDAPPQPQIAPPLSLPTGKKCATG